jgi:hypothetical protein
LGIDVVRGRVGIARQIELHADLRAAQRARRGHLVDAGNLRQLTLERSRDRGRHRLGIGPRQAGLDLDGRKLDLGDRRDRQLIECEDAGQKDGGHQQGRGDRAVDEGFRQGHRIAAP